MILKRPGGEFTLEDFKNQLLRATRLNPLRSVMKAIPGFGSLTDESRDVADPEQDMKRLFGIIDSMTPTEKRTPKIIDQSRQKRIAVGAGVAPHEVDELVRLFEPIAEMMNRGPGLNDGRSLKTQY